MLQREAAGTRDILVPKQKCDVRITNSDAFEIIVVPAHQVEKILAAVAVENHFAVARALDDDRFFGRAAGGEVISAVKGSAVRSDGAIEAAIDEAIVLVESGVDQNDVARLDARRKCVRVVGLVGAHVVRGHQCR